MPTLTFRTAVLLPAIDPAGEDEEQQVPWLKLGFHVPPDARFRSGGSGIVGYQSRVAPSVRPARSKTRVPRQNAVRVDSVDFPAYRT